MCEAGPYVCDQDHIHSLGQLTISRGSTSGLTVAKCHYRVTCLDEKGDVRFTKRLSEPNSGISNRTTFPSHFRVMLLLLYLWECDLVEVKLVSDQVHLVGVTRKPNSPIANAMCSVKFLIMQLAYDLRGP